MGIRLNTNTTALTAYRHIGTAQERLTKSVERLSSGLRINHAQDDPAGLAIAERIRTQRQGLARASMNAQDGTSLLQTAEAALGEVTSMLHRIRELAIQAANGTLTSADRVEIQREVDQLLDEIDRTATATEFNTKKLLDGSSSALVSVDDSGLTPIVTGDKVAQGNYRIEMEMTPGKAQVLKSDIFQIVKGEQYKNGTRGLAGDISALEDVTLYQTDDGAGNTDIVLRRRDGTTLAVTASGDASGPSLSPDGQTVVYSRAVGGATNLYTFDLDSLTETQVTNWGAGSTAAGATWSADGSQLAYVGTTGGASNVYVVSATSAVAYNGIQITSDNDVVASSVSFSPITKRLVYRSTANGVAYLNADGTDRTSVAGAAYTETPQWSPDGTQILLGDGTDIFTYDVAAGALTNLTGNTGANTSTAAAWSADGSRIAFVHDDGTGVDIHVMNADGSNVVDLTGATTYLTAATPSDLNWTSDGSTIYFTGDDGTDTEVYRIATTGGVEQNVSDDAGIDEAQLSVGRTGYWVARESRSTAADFTQWQDLEWSSDPDDDAFPGSPNHTQDFRTQHMEAPRTGQTASVTAGAATWASAGTVTSVVVALDATGREIGRSAQLQTTLAAATEEIGLSWDGVANAATYRIWYGDADAGTTGYVDVASPATTTTLTGPPVLTGVLPSKEVAGDRFGVVDYDMRSRWSGFQLARTGSLGADTDSSQAPYVVLEVAGVRVTNDAAASSLSGDQMVIDNSLIDADSGEYMQRIQIRATTYSRSGEVQEQKTFEMDANQWTQSQDLLNGTAFADLAGNYGGTTVQCGANGDVVSVRDKVVLLYDGVDQYSNGVVWTSQNTSDLGSFELDTDGYHVRSGAECDRVGARTQAPSDTGSLSEVTYSQSLAWVDRDGIVHIGTGDVRYSDQPTQSLDFNLTESTLAERVTKLQWVDRFQVDESSIFDVQAQKLTMYMNGASVDIVLQASDTLEEVATKLRKGMTASTTLGGLGLGVDGDESSQGVDGNVGTFVSDPTETTDEAVPGTMVLRSTLPGMEGRIYFAGDDQLINGFSWAEVVAPTLNNMDVTVYDAHTGALVGYQSVTDGALRSVISGVDVEIRGDADTRVEWNDARKRFDIASGFGKSVKYLHVVDNSLNLQIGPNAGHRLEARIGSVTRTALGLDNIILISRDVAEEALTKVDYAVDYVNSQRARLGAYINRLNTTVSILDVTQENLTASESRIRDVDMAAQTADFTRDQVLVQASTAMLAQANTLPQTVLRLLQ